MSKRSLFIIAALLLAAAGLYAQFNSATSARSQAQAITTLDESDASTVAQVNSLKSYVAEHMGTSVTIQLTGSYNRAQAASASSTQAAQAAQSANAQVYADAQKSCMSKADSITQAKCNAAYLQTHLSTAPTPTPVAQPKLSDYQIPLTAPFWTPDLAGALMVGALAAFVVALVVVPKRRA
jgi:hypothetical protein